MALVPRLAIGDRYQFQDRFLVVRGNLLTTKIHLGSGNILMEPKAPLLAHDTQIKDPSILGQISSTLGS